MEKGKFKIETTKGRIYVDGWKNDIFGVHIDDNRDYILTHLSSGSYIPIVGVDTGYGPEILNEIIVFAKELERLAGKDFWLSFNSDPTSAKEFARQAGKIFMGEIGL